MGGVGDDPAEHLSSYDEGVTFAPPSLLAARRVFKSRWPHIADADFGIVGGPSHILQGTSYHLGRDQLKLGRDPYSVRTARDKAGLSDAASALDITDQIGPQLLRSFSIWLVTECRAQAPDTLDIREVIYSPDGVVVLTWDRERGNNSFPQQRGGASHKEHTHIDWYRDSEFHDRAAVFRRFFAERENMLRDEILTIPGETLKTGQKVPSDGALTESFDAASAVAFGLRHAYAARLGVEAALDRLDALAAKVDALQPGGPATDEQLERVLRKIFRSVPE